MKNTITLACICLLSGMVTATSLWAGPASACGTGQTHHSASSQKPMTVDDVIALVQAGLPDDLIIAQLKQKNQSFTLSTDDLIRLRKANVSNAVIKVMLDPKAATASPEAPSPQPATQTVVIAPTVPGLAVAKPSGATPAPGTASTANSNDPMAPHDSGIYLYAKDHQGQPEMIPLERAAYQGAKTGGMFASAMTYGIMKAKTRAVIPGAKAGIRVSDVPAVFYFYFDDKDAGLNGTSRFGVGNLSNPNQFALLNREVHKSDRETIIGQFSTLGSSSGSDEKSMIAFKSERVRSGLYKVTVADMKPGEYCFLASGNVIVAAGPYGAYGGGGAGAAGAVDIFDFGVDTE